MFPVSTNCDADISGWWKMNQWALLLAIATVLLLFAGLAYSLWAEPIQGMADHSDGYDSNVQGGFDRESCERNCRNTYWAPGMRSRNRLGYSLYYGCMQDCENKAWQEFYRNTRNGNKRVR
jgi:hypothetical protein